MYQSQRSLGAVCMFVACVSWAGAILASETKMTLESLPAAVRKTATMQSRGATIRGISKEVSEGKTVYEVEMKVGGHSKDILIGADGTLLVAEEAIALAALPAPVKSTFEKHAGKGKIMLVETVTQGDTLAYYEAHVRTGKKESEIKVAKNGALLH